MNRKIEIAAEILKDTFGYVKGSNSGLAFDFVIDEDGDILDVFNANSNDDTFFWPESICQIVVSLNLSCHVSTSNIVVGKDKYGREIMKQTIVMRIH